MNGSVPKRPIARQSRSTPTPELPEKIGQSSARAASHAFVTAIQYYPIVNSPSSRIFYGMRHPCPRAISRGARLSAALPLTASKGALTLSGFEEESRVAVRGLRAGESIPAPQAAGPARGIASLRAEKRPAETKNQTGVACATGLWSWKTAGQLRWRFGFENQEPAQRFPGALRKLLWLPGCPHGFAAWTLRFAAKEKGAAFLAGQPEKPRPPVTAGSVVGPVAGFRCRGSGRGAGG